MDINYLESAQPEITSIGTDLDAVNRSLSQMVEMLDHHSTPSVPTENTSPPISYGEQTKGVYTKTTSFTTDQEAIELVVHANIFGPQSPQLLSHVPLPNIYSLSQVDKIGQTILNPKTPGQVPITGFIVTATDWVTEPLSPDVHWEHGHKSVSPYLLDVIAEREDITGFVLFSMWTESLTASTVPEIDKNNIWAEILERFDVIAQREDNWDGYESKSPNKLSLANARQFMNEFVDVIVSEGEWPLTPSLISSDEDGHITVEWHGEGRQLHLQIEEKEVDYIQVWGPNIDTEMHVGTFHSKDYLTLWEWLIYGK